MKIALIGATGYVGSHVLNEALSRAHSVTAISRNAHGIFVRQGLTTLALDFQDAAGLAAAVHGHDAVVLAVKCQSLDAEALLDVLRRAGVPRLIAVGGAGSLEVSPGLDFVDSPDMKPQWKPEALAARAFLHLLRAEKLLDWSMISPSAVLVPGERTGQFRIGGDQLLRDAGGESHISLQDLACALVDELETPRHSRQRFTVGY